MVNNIFIFFRNAIQTGLAFGLVMIILELIIQYVYAITILKIIFTLSFILCVPLFVFFKKIEIERNKKVLFTYFSKVYQIGFFIFFIFKIYLHQYIDINLKYRLADNKVSEMRERLKKVELENKVVIENKSENLNFIYEDVVNSFSILSLIKNFLGVGFIVFVFSFFIAYLFSSNLSGN